MTTNTHPFLSENTSFITKTLIDTEAFCSFMKNLALRNETVISDFVGTRWNNPISNRIPVEIEAPAPGFDAAVAVLLGLAKESHIKDIINFHLGNYGEETIQKMRNEIEAIKNFRDLEDLDQMSTYWWLAFSSLCTEGEATTEEFYNQYLNAVKVAQDPEIRYASAINCLNKIQNSFQMDEKTSLPFGTTDGCLHASYLSGHEVASMYASAYDLYFLGTYVPGKFKRIIDLFQFSEDTDNAGRTKSGVINSTFLKFKDYQEMQSALALL